MKTQLKFNKKICWRCDDSFYVLPSDNWKDRCYKCYLVTCSSGFNCFKDIPFNRLIERPVQLKIDDTDFLD